MVKALSISPQGFVTETDVGSAPAPDPSPVRAGRLLVYYGYPSDYKNLWDVDAVVADIAANYEVYVVGDGYQNPSQEVYAETVQIVAGLGTAGVRCYGYVPIGGAAGENRTMATLKAAVDAWTVMGVVGIFLDEFGFDYGITRERQAEIVAYCHSKGLVITANAGDWIDYAYDDINDITEFEPGSYDLDMFANGNPNNVPLERIVGDGYMFEDFGFSERGPGSFDDVQARVYKGLPRLNALGTKLWGLAVFKDSSRGKLSPVALGGECDSLPHAGAYIAAMAYVFGIDVVGTSGYSMGSYGGTPLSAALPLMPPTAQLPAGGVAMDAERGVVSREFGPVSLAVFNNPQAGKGFRLTNAGDLSEVGYSASDEGPRKVYAEDIEAGGTASSTTYLRGDGKWATPAAASDTASSLEVTDTRNVAHTPKTFPSQRMQAEFKASSVVGSPPITSTAPDFSWVLSIQGWYGDGSGGWPVQWSIGNSGMAYRHGVSKAAWSAWRLFLTEDTVHEAPAKTAIDDDDELPLLDSTAGDSLCKVTVDALADAVVSRFLAGAKRIEVVNTMPSPPEPDTAYIVRPSP